VLPQVNTEADSNFSIADSVTVKLFSMKSTIEAMKIIFKENYHPL
jgi:hypothetical protein